MGSLIVIAIAAAVGGIGGNAAGGFFPGESRGWVARTITGMAGGIGAGTVFTQIFGTPLPGIAFIHLLGVTGFGFVTGAALAGIAGLVSRFSR